MQCIVGDIGSTDKSKLQAATEFAEETTNHIINFRKKIEGNIHGVRYTAREIRMAMILYSMSPSGYCEICNSDIQILPSISLLKKYKKEIKVQDGCDPLSYGTLRDRLNVKPGEIVSATLMFDEMKLKNVIYTNIVTGEIVGFASNDMTLESCREDICSMMKEIEKEQDNGDYEFSVDDFDLEANVQASYVNQFCIRQIIGNKSTNVEFFFNDGSLSGNQIMFQLFHVLSMRIQISGFIAFAKIAFEVDKNIKYIPALLSNQSSLESSFSEKQARNDDSPQKYVKSTATESHVKASKALSSNKNHMYEGTVDMNENQVASVHFDKKLMSCICDRHKKVEAWMSSAKTDTSTIIQLPLMDSNAYDQYSSRFTSEKSKKRERDFDNSALMVYMKEKYTESNFLYTLVTKTKLVDSAKASVGTNLKTELWFKSLLTMKDKNDIKSFDCVCQRVVSLVLLFLKQTCSVSKGTRYASFSYNIYYSIEE